MLNKSHRFFSSSFFKLVNSRNFTPLLKPQLQRNTKSSSYQKPPVVSLLRTLNLTNNSNILTLNNNTFCRFYSTNIVSQNSSLANMAGIDNDWDLRNYNDKDIERLCKELIDKLRVHFDKAGQTKDPNFDSFLKPLLDANLLAYVSGTMVHFPRSVALNADVREASTKATKELEDYSVSVRMRKDIFDNLLKFNENEENLKNLSSEHKKYVDRMIKDGYRNGLHLSDEVRKKLTEVKIKINELVIKFTQNLTEENTFLLFSKEELAGISDDFLNGLDKDDNGKYKVTLKYPHFFPITRKCTVPDTRKSLEFSFQSICMKQNTEILEEVIELRQKECELLGYKNHATYVQELLMAENPEKVQAFLKDLSNKLTPLWNKDKEMMLKLKKEECNKNGYQFNNKIDFWDFRHFLTMIEEKNYKINQEEIKPYFPVDTVTDGILNIYEEILGLNFTHLPNAKKWTDDVKVYQVEDTNTNETMGYIYLDLFTRDGKYGHFRCSNLQPGCLDENGEKKFAIASMICNFTPPREDKPCLLEHNEVETYFHEFGHLMHTICSRATTARFFGTNVETDFLEAPSQMLENWAWEREPLKRMSGHYKTKEKLPDEIIEKLILAKDANSGATNLRQVVLATFDQLIYQGGRIDTQALYGKILKEIMGIDVIPGTNFAASFTHTITSYSARYYSYLWSEVFSMDMYSVFKSHGIFCKEIGERYRKCILEPGGSKDGNQMLSEFLGREPNNKAFLESKGLTL